MQLRVETGGDREREREQGREGRLGESMQAKVRRWQGEGNAEARLKRRPGVQLPRQRPPQRVLDDVASNICQAVPSPSRPSREAPSKFKRRGTGV